MVKANNKGIRGGGESGKTKKCDKESGPGMLKVCSGIDQPLPFLHWWLLDIFRWLTGTDFLRTVTWFWALVLLILCSKSPMDNFFCTEDLQAEQFLLPRAMCTLIIRIMNGFLHQNDGETTQILFLLTVFSFLHTMIRNVDS